MFSRKISNNLWIFFCILLVVVFRWTPQENGSVQNALNHLTIYGFLALNVKKKCFMMIIMMWILTKETSRCSGKCYKDIRVKKITEFTWKYVTFLNHFHENSTFHVFETKLLIVLFTFWKKKKWEFCLHLCARCPKLKPKCKQTSQFFKNQQK